MAEISQPQTEWIGRLVDQRSEALAICIGRFPIDDDPAPLVAHYVATSHDRLLNASAMRDTKRRGRARRSAATPTAGPLSF